MVHINEIILVEGKYDKIKLQSVTDANIVTLDGFSVFTDDEKIDALRSLADKRGLLVLTDSDAAGFKLRAFINGRIAKEKVKHAYIPDVFGKEKRKQVSSKEGKLGVEGISVSVLEEILTPFASDRIEPLQTLTKADLYADGLVGRPDSVQKRRAFTIAAGLPARIGSNALLEFVNAMLTKEQYQTLIANISKF
ncbi:MAG TPA: DUF4093 domain-containing protein [Oscillospiraceae bacterium]|nr:DUF4093 domain-containing protein [Oscillospiraceae bacterium]HPF56009.1 DUF4093 domain-containing protein [Clostridiales bacterium]HPK36329.1 DUF4093 domain-containing protein [Oscillospiraceae bacterium]HPR76102.1 DUF4093 domain-containing protein [Oscillospiraceae bacterium]